MSALSDMVGVLLPGGLAVGFVTLFQAYKSWREGRASREETVIKRWQQLAQDERERSRVAEQDEAYAVVVAEYWRACYADLEFEARRRHNMEIPVRPPIPAKRMRGMTSAQARRNKSRQTPDDDE